MIKELEPTGGARKPEARSQKSESEKTDFESIVALLAAHSTAENELAALEATANQEFLIIVDGMKPKYAKLQQRMIEAGTQLEVLSRKHPEWFADKKTIKTPYGSVQLKNNPPKIVSDNPELSIVLIEREKDLDPQFDVAKWLHEEKSLNLEALAGADDAQLKRWRLRREQTDTFTVKSAKLDMGKAVKEAAEKEKK